MKNFWCLAGFFVTNDVSKYFSKSVSQAISISTENLKSHHSNLKKWNSLSLEFLVWACISLKLFLYVQEKAACSVIRIQLTVIMTVKSMLQKALMKIEYLSNLSEQKNRVLNFVFLMVPKRDERAMKTKCTFIFSKFWYYCNWAVSHQFKVARRAHFRPCLFWWPNNCYFRHFLSDDCFQK